jgi:hypothetical protein
VLAQRGAGLACGGPVGADAAADQVNSKRCLSVCVGHRARDRPRLRRWRKGNLLRETEPHQGNNSESNAAYKGAGAGHNTAWEGQRQRQASDSDRPVSVGVSRGQPAHRAGADAPSVCVRAHMLKWRGRPPRARPCAAKRFGCLRDLLSVVTRAAVVQVAVCVRRARAAVRFRARAAVRFRARAAVRFRALAAVRPPSSVGILSAAAGTSRRAGRSPSCRPRPRPAPAPAGPGPGRPAGRLFPVGTRGSALPASHAAAG